MSDGNHDTAMRGKQHLFCQLLVLLMTMLFLAGNDITGWPLTSEPQVYLFRSDCSEME
jgi:hypothetical protein